MKTTFLTRSTTSVKTTIASACATLLAGASLSAAIIVEDFDNFPGSAADPGWLTGWVTSGGNSTTSNVNPLHGGGQYVTITNGSSTGNQNFGIRRQLDPTVLDPQARHTVAWDFRLESGASIYDGPNNTNNRLHFGATTNNDIGSNANWTWLVGLVGSDADYGNAAAGRTFYAYDRTQNPGSNGFFGSGNLLDTGVVLNEDEIYSFRVVVDPDLQSYDLTIVSDSGQAFTASGLGFRNQDPNALADRLVFAGNLPAGAADRASFSIDNLVLTPEPGRAILLLLGGLGLLARRRR